MKQVEEHELIDDFEKTISRLKIEMKEEIAGHTEFQLRNFVIGSQPTEYGKYRQCLAELRSRIKNYELLSAKIESLKSKESLSKEEIDQLSEHEILLEDLKRETYIIDRILEETKERVDLSKKDLLEIDYWDKKFGREMFACFVSGVPVSTSLIQNIMSLPDGCAAKNQLLETINSRIKNVEVKKLFKDQSLIDEQCKNNIDNS